MVTEKIEKIEKIKPGDKLSTSQSVPAEELQRQAPNKDKFDKLMDNSNTAVVKIEPTTKNSLIDEVKELNTKVDGFSKASPRELVAQADEAVKQIEMLKEKLSTPNLELKPSTQSLLNSKLTHIDENLRIALTKAGIEYAPPQKAPTSVSPIERYLGFLTHGQEQLKSLSHEVDLMHLNRKEITPANMLRIQIKVGYISQEIEFFTAVLNKALESTKTIMNIQV